jgi:hypothetical protein
MGDRKARQTTERQDRRQNAIREGGLTGGDTRGHIAFTAGPASIIITTFPSIS